MEQILDTLIYRLLNAPENISLSPIPAIVAGALISGGISLIGSLFSAGSANKQRKKAEDAIQFTGERAERFEEAGLKPTVTIGRWLFKPVDEIIDKME